MPTKICLICRKVFSKPTSCGRPEWAKRKYCNKECQLNATFRNPNRITWNKGLKRSNAHVPRTDEWKRKMSDAQKGRLRLHKRGINSPNFKHGKYAIDESKSKQTQIRGRVTIICQTCSASFEIYHHQLKENRRFCSSKCIRHSIETKTKLKGKLAWNKGLTKETDERLAEAGRKGSITNKALNRPSWNKGQKGLQIAWNKGKSVPNISREKHWNWQGGKTPLQRAIRCSLNYKLWAQTIRRRDFFRCVLCAFRSIGKGDIHVDHFPLSFSYLLKTFKITTLEKALACEALWNTDNGRTLCVECHRKTYGVKTA